MLSNSKNIFKLIGRHAVIALIAIIISLFIIYFITKSINNITSNIVLNRDLTSTLKKRTELFSAIEKDAQIISSSYPLINKAFISSENILDFITVLDGLTPPHSNIQRLNFGTPEPSEISSPFPLVTIPYGGSLTMNVSDFYKYLKNFETLPYFTKIEKININSQDKGGWNSTSTATFEATLYAKDLQ